MYHIVVEQTQRQMSELVQDENDYSEVFHEDPSSDFVEFSVGNPRVEHITGLVHLYKRNTAPHGSARAFRTSNATRGSGAAQVGCSQQGLWPPKLVLHGSLLSRCRYSSTNFKWHSWGCPVRGTKLNSRSVCSRLQMAYIVCIAICCAVLCHLQASAGQEVDFSRTVCCLAIPADMSVAHFCSFIGAYLREVSAIQASASSAVCQQSSSHCCHSTNWQLTSSTSYACCSCTKAADSWQLSVVACRP